jgi:hypothetical protein
MPGRGFAAVFRGEPLFSTTLLSFDHYDCTNRTATHQQINNRKASLCPYLNLRATLVVHKTVFRATRLTSTDVDRFAQFARSTTAEAISVNTYLGSISVSTRPKQRVTP